MDAGGRLETVASSPGRNRRNIRRRNGDRGRGPRRRPRGGRANIPRRLASRWRRRPEERARLARSGRARTAGTASGRDRARFRVDGRALLDGSCLGDRRSAGHDKARGATRRHGAAGRQAGSGSRSPVSQGLLPFWRPGVPAPVRRRRQPRGRRGVRDGVRSGNSWGAHGYRPEYAATVEGCNSRGGQRDGGPNSYPSRSRRPHIDGRSSGPRRVRERRRPCAVAGSNGRPASDLVE